MTIIILHTYTSRTTLFMINKGHGRRKGPRDGRNAKFSTNLVTRLCCTQVYVHVNIYVVHIYISKYIHTYTYLLSLIINSDYTSNLLFTATAYDPSLAYRNVLCVRTIGMTRPYNDRVCVEIQMKQHVTNVHN
jgi:hypothetical protein